MTWLAWRQHRLHAAVLAGLLAVITAYYVISGHRLEGSPSPFGSETLARNMVQLSIGVPLLLGAFLGATLVARETEQSTHVLAWTQTITRRRWLAGKLAAVFGITVAWTAALAAVVTWWSARAYPGDRIQGVRFDTSGLAPVAYSLFAVALGFAAGAVLRRLMPAVATTVAGFFGLRLWVELSLRSHYATPLRVDGLAAMVGPNDGRWVLNQKIFEPGGALHQGGFEMPRQCEQVVDRQRVAKCLADAGYRFVETYHPTSRYWQFQWTEAAVFTAVAVVLVAVGAWFVLRRDA